MNKTLHFLFWCMPLSLDNVISLATDKTTMFSCIVTASNHFSLSGFIYFFKKGKEIFYFFIWGRLDDNVQSLSREAWIASLLCEKDTSQHSKYGQVTIDLSNISLFSKMGSAPFQLPVHSADRFVLPAATHQESELLFLCLSLVLKTATSHGCWVLCVAMELHVYCHPDSSLTITDSFLVYTSWKAEDRHTEILA